MAQTKTPVANSIKMVFSVIRKYRSKLVPRFEHIFSVFSLSWLNVQNTSNFRARKQWRHLAWVLTFFRFSTFWFFQIYTYWVKLFDFFKYIHIGSNFRIACSNQYKITSFWLKMGFCWLKTGGQLPFTSGRGKTLAEVFVPIFTAQWNRHL